MRRMQVSSRPVAFDLCGRFRPRPERDKILHVGSHMSAMRTGEVRDRAASDRIGRFGGRTCFGKRNGFAATGAIDNEVPFVRSSDFCLRRASPSLFGQSRIASQVRRQNTPAAGLVSRRQFAIDSAQIDRRLHDGLSMSFAAIIDKVYRDPIHLDRSGGGKWQLVGAA